MSDAFGVPSTHRRLDRAPEEFCPALLSEMPGMERVWPGSPSG